MRSTHNNKYNMNSSHYHGHCEILYIMEGKRTLIINNTKAYGLSKNSIAIIPPGAIHRTISDSDEPQTKIIIAISKEFADSMKNFLPSLSAVLGSVYVAEFNDILKSEISNVLNNILSANNKNSKDERIKLYTAELLLKLYQNAISKSDFQKQENSLGNYMLANERK